MRADCTFLRLPALVEEAWTAARSAVSCWVSLFEGQELPALLLSPAHDNTKRGKTSPANDRLHSHGPKTFEPGGRETDQPPATWRSSGVYLRTSFPTTPGEWKWLKLVSVCVWTFRYFAHDLRGGKKQTKKTCCTALAVFFKPALCESNQWDTRWF